MGILCSELLAHRVPGQIVGDFSDLEVDMRRFFVYGAYV